MIYTDFMFYHKGMNTVLSYNFNQAEFDCKCKYTDCHHTLLHIALVRKLEEARKILGVKLAISSGFRCQKHNTAVGGVSNSQHMLGGAADVIFPENIDKNLMIKVMQDIFPFVKIYDTFIHCDLRLSKDQ